MNVLTFSKLFLKMIYPAVLIDILLYKFHFRHFVIATLFSVGGKCFGIEDLIA